MATNEQIAAMIEAASELVKRAQEAYPRGHRRVIECVCENAVGMALDEAEAVSK